MVEVELADQQKINEFSKLNTRLTQHERAIDSLTQDSDALQDVTLELELVDEDEKLPYRIGDSFVMLPQSVVMERLEKDQQELNGKIEQRKEEKASTVARMEELKTHLYAKFGRDSINLER